MKHDIRILEELQPNYPIWPKDLTQALRSVKIPNGSWNGILTVESISTPFAVEKWGFKIHPSVQLIRIVFENPSKNYGLYLFDKPKIQLPNCSPETSSSWDREMARVIVLEEIETNLQITKCRTFYENDRFIFQHYKEHEATFLGSFLQKLKWKDFFVDPDAQETFTQNQEDYGYEEYEAEDEEFHNLINQME